VICRGSILINRNFHFGLRDPIQYQSSRHRSDPKSCISSSGSRLRPARRGCHPARKVQDRKTISFQCIPRTPLRPPRPGRPDFAVSSPSRYPVATGKTAILRTIAPNNRLVRWLSANSASNTRRVLPTGHNLAPVRSSRYLHNVGSVRPASGFVLVGRSERGAGTAVGRRGRLWGALFRVIGSFRVVGLTRRYCRRSRSLVTDRLP
jgi:hypothetical protein